jgi:hypothetical protein
MSGAMLLFLLLGAVALILGIGLMSVALQGGVNASPRNHLFLIAGMMSTAFGLVLGGFAIGYATAGPLDLNTAAPK